MIQRTGAVFTFVAIVLAGCRSASPEAPAGPVLPPAPKAPLQPTAVETPPAQVRIGAATLLADSFPADSVTHASGAPLCRMDLHPPVPLTDTNLVMGGKINCDSSFGRSLLMQSTDGGATWTERANPLQSSEVSWLYFVNPRLGYAIVSWYVEGPGKEVLFRTDDGGTSWNPVSQLPKGRHPAQASSWALSFANADSGQVDLIFTVDSGAEVLARFVTQDGGKTWTFAEMLAAQAENTNARFVRAFDSLQVNLKYRWELREEEGRWVLRRTEKRTNQGKDIAVIPEMTLVRGAVGTLAPLPDRKKRSK